jgi:hypothetical protein
MIDTDAYKKHWKPYFPKPYNSVYFWPYQGIIVNSAFHLWDVGLRERFEIIFDQQVILGPRARMWYPVVARGMQQKDPLPASILPIDPLFRTDDELLPLQAADFMAGCFRRSVDDSGCPPEQDIGWLAGEMPTLRLIPASHWWTEEEMLELVNRIQKNVVEPLLRQHHEIYGNEDGENGET